MKSLQRLEKMIKQNKLVKWDRGNSPDLENEIIVSQYGKAIMQIYNHGNDNFMKLLLKIKIDLYQRSNTNSK